MKKPTLKFFKESEFACKCGCTRLPKPETMELADRIREAWGKPLRVTSGFRCDKHTANLILRGTKTSVNSKHNRGEAVDLQPIDIADIKEFHKICIDIVDDFDFYLEDTAFTPSWAHCQITPPASGKKIFKPW